MHVPRQGFKFKASALLNFNFKICDSTLKLEMTEINLPVNLNLNFRRRQLQPCCRGAVAQTASIEWYVRPRQVE